MVVTRIRVVIDLYGPFRLPQDLEIERLSFPCVESKVKVRERHVEIVSGNTVLMGAACVDFPIPVPEAC